MPKSKYAEVEAQYGQPMPEVLTALFDMYGDKGKVADVLNISRSTLTYWLAISGLYEVSRLIPISEYGLTLTEKGKQALNGATENG